MKVKIKHLKVESPGRQDSIYVAIVTYQVKVKAKKLNLVQGKDYKLTWDVKIYEKNGGSGHDGNSPVRTLAGDITFPYNGEEKVILDEKSFWEGRRDDGKQASPGKFKFKVVCVLMDPQGNVTLEESEEKKEKEKVDSPPVAFPSTLSVFRQGTTEDILLFENANTKVPVDCILTLEDGSKYPVLPDDYNLSIDTSGAGIPVGVTRDTGGIYLEVSNTPTMPGVLELVDFGFSYVNRQVNAQLKIAAGKPSSLSVNTVQQLSTSNPVGQFKVRLSYTDTAFQPQDITASGNLSITMSPPSAQQYLIIDKNAGQIRLNAAALPPGTSIPVQITCNVNDSAWNVNLTKTVQILIRK